MISKCKVSVVIPVYNRANTVLPAINSVLQQSYSDIELIIVDDCSSDDSVEVIKKIKDNRVKLVELKVNVGACEARNIGITHSTGRLIAFNDSDDLWHSNKLEKQISCLMNKKADVVFCSYQRVCESGTKVFPKKKISGNFVKYNAFLKHSLASTQTLLCKREVFEKEMFDSQILRFQDWEFMLRVSKLGTDIFFMDEVLVDVYLQENSISKDKKKGIKSLFSIFLKNKQGFLLSPKAFLLIIWKFLRLL
ncbi:glycosyltransferase [Vibrio alginolyticus]|nr:glycosyltransferase [Vibrio alginolyticus]